VVLCCSADEGNASDVDLFRDGVFIGPRSHRLRKRVEVHHDEVDGGELVLFHGGRVACGRAASEDAAEHLRVQRFHPPAEDGGVGCEGFDRNDLSAEPLEFGLGTACRVNSYS